MSKQQRRQNFPRPAPPKKPAAPPATGHLDRAARMAKTKKLKVAAAVSGLIAATFFSGLAAKAGGTQAHSGVVSADQQVSRLEQSNNGAFFSVGGSVAPPLPGNGGAQTSSGGS
jgi:hypothetical protein